MIGIIAAVSKNGVIGKDGKLPFSYPDDMKFFRDETRHCVVIMGRKTFESIGKPLVNRRNIVITSQSKIDGAECFALISDAIESTQQRIPNKPWVAEYEKVFFIGGSQIYREGMKWADTICLTLTPDIIEGENLTYFPWIDPTEFRAVQPFHELVHGAETQLITLRYERVLS